MRRSGEALRIDGHDVRTFNEQQAADLGPPLQDPFTIRSWPELAQYVKQGIGETLPAMGAITVGAMAGGAVIGGTAVIGSVTVGELLGGFVPAAVYGLGETQSGIKAADPTVEAPGYAFLGGTAIGALDTIIPGHVGSKLVRVFGRGTAESVAKATLQAIAKPRWLVQTAKGAVIGLTAEGFTEAVQEGLGIVTAAKATGTPIPEDAGRRFGSRRHRRDGRDALRGRRGNRHRAPPARPVCRRAAAAGLQRGARQRRHRLQARAAIAGGRAGIPAAGHRERPGRVALRHAGDVDGLLDREGRQPRRRRRSDHRPHGGAR